VYKYLEHILGKIQNIFLTALFFYIHFYIELVIRQNKYFSID